MNANHLLMTIVRETAAANRLIDGLAQHAATHEVVLAYEVRAAADALDTHLRTASAAATALRSLASGNEEPKRGA